MAPSAGSVIRALVVTTTEGSVLFTAKGVKLQTGSGDTPANVFNRPIWEPDSYEYYISGYSIKEGATDVGGVCPVVWSTVRLRNRPVKIDGERPLDDVLNWTWNGATFAWYRANAVYVDRRWQAPAWSTFSQYAHGVVAGELGGASHTVGKTRSDTATLQLIGILDTLKEQPISPRKFLGLGGAFAIPADSSKYIERSTKTEMITTGDITWMWRMKIVSGSSTTLERVYDEPQMRILVSDNDVQIRIRLADGTRSTLNTTAVTVGEYYTWTVVYRSTGNEVDVWQTAESNHVHTTTKIVDATALGQSLYTTNSAVQWLAASDLHVTHWAFSRRWNKELTETHIKARVIYNLNISIETSLVMALEANTGGSTIAYDSSGTEDGRINGYTNDTDAWVPTFTGDEALAGVRIPVGSTFFNAPALSLYGPHAYFALCLSPDDPVTVAMLANGEVLAPDTADSPGSRTFDATFDFVDPGNGVKPVFAIGQKITVSAGLNAGDFNVKNRIFDPWVVGSPKPKVYVEEAITADTATVILSSHDDEAIWEEGTEGDLLYTNWRIEVVRQDGGAPPIPTGNRITSIVTRGLGWLTLKRLLTNATYSMGYSGTVTEVEQPAQPRITSYWAGEMSCADVLDEVARSTLSSTSNGPSFVIEDVTADDWMVTGFLHPDDGTAATNLTFVEREIKQTINLLGIPRNREAGSRSRHAAAPDFVRLGYRRNYAPAALDQLAGFAQQDESVYPRLTSEYSFYETDSGDQPFDVLSTIIWQEDAIDYATLLKKIQDGTVLRFELRPVSTTVESALERAIGKLSSWTDTRHPDLQTATEGVILAIRIPINEYEQAIPLIDVWFP